MKKALGIIAVTLAAGCVFAAGCSGCNGTGKNVSPLASNWYANTSFRNIQPSFIEGNKGNDGNPLFKAEKITYDVNFIKPVGGNATYSVEYKNGSYTTEFYAKAFDTSKIHSDHTSGYPTKDIIAYYYNTEFTADITYTFGDDSETFEKASVVTECYFLSVADELRPLYSKQTVKSPSPAVLQATSLESCYKLYDMVYTSYYSYNGKSVITQITDNLDGDNSKVVKRGVGGTSNSLFDVTSLDIVLRALIGSSFNQTIDLYSPLNSIKSFTLSSPSTSLNDVEKEDITKILKDKGLYVPVIKDEKEVGLQTTAVTVTSNTQLPGVSQTYWFAKVENKRNNTGRATLLKISLPIVFNLGTLEYKIKEISSTLWNE